ncbi:serine hydrolase domain-containing protein [Roseicella aerolata]|uniref:Beta-lactamase family protein n=1 Tax=Roseicella aerolata TaxID=2883479 RepID=A0A9X1IBI4_9PROT|nr:serine hydrolase domain-containing protein [Roseicella aerolata]MCB4821342.1 beta-lactamase family protein [Roseicella aerolata]
MSALPASPPSGLPSGRPEEVGLSTPRLEAMGRVLEARIAAGHLPGAVVLVMRRGRLAWHQAYGRRDPAAAEPMRTDSIFRIYSMTKPMVSVGIMMLVEEGRLLLADPIGQYLPELASPQVAVAGGGTVPAAAPITVQDLLRHTSGLTYEFLGNGPVHKAYLDAKIARRGQGNADQVATLGRLPLLHQPGTRWEYSRSTDVLGRLIEVISGQTLGAFLEQRICRPLGMADTAFHVPPAQQHRLAEGFPKDPDTGAEMPLLEVREPPQFESGGGGMVSTAADYAQLVHMLLDGGRLRSVRLLSRKTVELMTADHLGDRPADPVLLGEGWGFGLGFAVRRGRGLVPTPGSAGMYHWSGMAGTTFWIDPAEQLAVVYMMQGIGQRNFYRALMRDMVYAAIAD